MQLINQLFGSWEGFLGFLVPVGVFFATVIVGYIVRKICFSRLERWSRNTQTQIDDIIISSVKSPFIIWFVMLGLYFGLASSPLAEEFTRITNKVLLVLGILSVTIVLSNIAGKFINAYSSKVDAALPVSSLTYNISRVIILGMGLLIILNSLGISITPILTTLGVGGIAVALALQDTLTNLFAGFHIIVTKQIRIGDYVKLETGEEGYVTDINWRTTKIRMLPNNVVLVPNEKLSKSIVTNYYMPEKEMAIVIDLGVHYKSDLEKVEQVTIAVAREVMEQVSGGVPGFVPFVRYHSFGEWQIGFSVILRAKEYVDQYMIKHEFIKRLHRRYAQEGIIIPYPIRAVNYDQEKTS